MHSIARSTWFVFLTLASCGCLTGFRAVAAEPPVSGQRFEPTHIIGTETPYYTTGPQQGRPPEGKLKPGTRVQLLQDADNYCQVKTEAGLFAYVSPESLNIVFSKAAITPDVENVAVSLNGFAFDLYREVGKKEGNLFISPASISTALAMTYAGAAGQTEQEMAQVLHFDRNPTQLPVDRFHEAYGQLTRLLNSGGNRGGYVLRTANRLWGPKSSRYHPEFLKITREQYGAELAALDFEQPEKASREINAWVEQQTQQKIKDLTDASMLQFDDVGLVLINAIYFSGTWSDEFSKHDTRNQPFFTSAEQRKETPFMMQTRRFPFADLEDLQVLQLPYRGEEISMVVLLPRARGGLQDLEAALTAENVRQWMDSCRPREVAVYLPKFKLTTQVSLAEPLYKMGMVTAFSRRASDLSKITQGERLFISKVIHKAFVDVNEQGTEAAAATAIAVAKAVADVQAPEPVVFRADHPFMFLLKDHRTGAILFLGRLSDPN